jgi:cysteine desulfurase
MAYLDYAASNPIDPDVCEAIGQALELTGNPSSVHRAGREVRELIDRSRLQVAKLIGVRPSEIVFTSGATEANHTALFGYFRRLREIYGPEQELRLLTTYIEHSSVRGLFARLAAEYGIAVDRLSVSDSGVARVSDVRGLIRDTTVLVCAMWVNNVIGSVQPVDEIGRVIAEAKRERADGGLPLAFMSDAVQAMRTEEVRPLEAGIDILTLSGHKMYGPKGVGALWVRSGIELAPLISGGGQESGFRGGTENVSGIAGLGRAAEIMIKRRRDDRNRIVELTERLRSGIAGIRGFSLIGEESCVAPGFVYAVSGREDGDRLTLKLDCAGIAVSSGSACDSGTRKTSAVLAELSVSQRLQRGGIRISLGRFTAQSEIEKILAELSWQK